MNYLAHLYLGRKTDASMVGNLLGDFVKGNEASLLEQFPSTVVDGIIMHRKIDKFTDAHPCFQEAKILLSSHLSRFAGILIDIFFDHFLAIHWSTYGEGELETFVDYAHTTLLKHPEWHSESLQQRLPHIIENQVLLSYLKREGIKTALERVASRGKRTSALVEGYDDFIRNYDAFEKIFQQFFPVLKNYAATLAPSAELDEKKTVDLSDEELIITWRQHAVVMAERGFFPQSLVGHFKSKGVSPEAAEKASQAIILEVSKKRENASKLLLIPGVFMIFLAIFILFIHSLIHHEVTANRARNTAAAMIAVTIGIVFISKSKNVR